MSDHFSQAPETVLDELDVDAESGLDSSEVERRRDEFGPNRLPSEDRRHPLAIFVKQFKDVLILILFAAAGISLYAGQMANAWIILGIILFNASMGFFQEYKAEKAVESIKSMVRRTARVLRENEEREIPVEKIVPGDLLVLQEGDSVAADARLIEVRSLQTDESALTGESEPVTKQTEQVDEDTELADRACMVWKGTHVVRGSGRAVVTAIGEATELGDIAAALSRMERPESNFRRKTARLGRKMATIAICTSLVVFALGFFYRDFPLQDILLITIATMVSSIPEGLPVVTSIVLAIGAHRMARRNAIIREFTATEVLGSVSTILTDKTGTLTQNIMTVRRLVTADRRRIEVTGQGHELDGEFRHDEDRIDVDEETDAVRRLLGMALFCNQARIDQGEDDNGNDDGNDDGNGESQAEDDREVDGDPTEVALRVLGEKSGLGDQSPWSKLKVLDQVPFNSERKFRGTLVDVDGSRQLFVAGAPERILELSDRILDEDGERTLEDEDRDWIDETNEHWADDALRVIALGYRSGPEDGAGNGNGNGTDKNDGRNEADADDVDELVWVGLVGMDDPPRHGVEKAVAECRGAGIRVVMVTGDHRKTAAAIARATGIIDADDENGRDEGSKAPVTLSESDLEDLSSDEFAEAVERVSVFARVSPTTKLRIAEALQEKGQLIAMTGDGMNDAPALKKADVGIAMGIRGTDVARNSADIVLSDDDFSSIVSAIREGRIVFKNVRTTAYFLLTTNFASTSTLIASLLMGLPIPLTAIQILWVNIVTDGVMDVAKATEPGHGEMMKRDPIAKDEPILTWSILPHLLIMAMIMVSMAIWTFQHYLPQGLAKAQTATFLVIAMTQVFNAFNMRDLDRSVFEIGLFSNRWINVAFLASLVLQLAVVKLPFLQGLFGFVDIGYLEFFVITAAASAVLWAGELYKLVQRRIA